MDMQFRICSKNPKSNSEQSESLVQARQNSPRLTHSKLRHSNYLKYTQVSDKQ